MEYLGVERRATERRGCAPGDPFCDDHLHRVVNDKITACKSDISADIHAIRENMSKIEAKQDTLTSDVHKLSIAVNDIAINSGSIAESLKGMSGMFETYKTLVGINNFLGWMRGNIVLVITIVVLVMFITGKIDLKAMVEWIL